MHLRKYLLTFFFFHFFFFKNFLDIFFSLLGCRWVCFLSLGIKQEDICVVWGQQRGKLNKECQGAWICLDDWLPLCSLLCWTFCLSSAEEGTSSWWSQFSSSILKELESAFYPFFFFGREKCFLPYFNTRGFNNYFMKISFLLIDDYFNFYLCFYSFIIYDEKKSGKFVIEINTFLLGLSGHGQNFLS